LNIDKIISDLNGRNFRTYRAAYSELTFDQIKKVCNGIDDVFPNQDHGHYLPFVELFGKFSEVPLNVIELGCHQGHLASAMLKIYSNIKSWTGYDICESSMARSIVSDKRFQTVELTNWFGSVALPKFDVLVSSHTLEHLNWDQLQNMMRVLTPKPTWMFLEFPVNDWPLNHSSTHVLYIKRKDFDGLMDEVGYRKIYHKDEGKKGAIYITGWTRK
jgi:hypothetical protein